VGSTLAAARRNRKPVGMATIIRLRDGTAVTLRPLAPGDRALIADAFERLSPRSRYLRFFTPMPRLPTRTLDALMDVDQVDHIALIALHEGRAVGVVRAVRDRDDRALAHLALTVVDAYQGRGLGRALIAAIRDAAAARGVRALALDVHPENDVMLRLTRSLGVSLGFRDGALSGRLALHRPHIAAAPLAEAA
jgi:GNAT superfamily N-acetyltransferase